MVHIMLLKTIVPLRIKLKDKANLGLVYELFQVELHETAFACTKLLFSSALLGMLVFDTYHYTIHNDIHGIIFVVPCF